MKLACRSLADDSGKLHDDRVLAVSGNFFFLEDEALKYLIFRVAEKTKDYLGDLFLEKWETSGSRIEQRKIINSKRVLQYLSENPFADFFCSAYAKGNRLQTAKDVKEYEREHLFPSIPFPIGVQKDFNSNLSYHLAHFCQEPLSDQELKQELLNMFWLPGQYGRCQYDLPEIEAGCWLYPHRETQYQELSHGFFYISISYASLLQDEQLLADSLSSFLRELGEKCRNINGTVSLQPRTCTISRTPSSFGFPVRPERKPLENYPGQFLTRTEWCNCISPGTVSNWLPELEVKASQNQAVQVESLRNGAVMVYLKQPISTTDVKELAHIRRILYPALYPSGIGVRLEGLCDRENPVLLRRFWERIPIWPEEISIRDNMIVFETLKMKDGPTIKSRDPN